MRPLVSVITVVYNACSTIEATIRSVLEQNEGLCEYWIIDGGSTDGTLDVIRKYERRLAGWISEPDKGIYEAMNKGIRRSDGQWLYFLGGDDTLHSGVLLQLAPYLTSPRKLVYGDVLLNNGQVMKSIVGPRLLLQNTIHHQGTFYNRSLFDDFSYDEKIGIQADYELNLRVYVNRLPIRYVPIQIATYTLGGQSAGHSEQSFFETNSIRSRYVRSPIKRMTLTALLRLYYWQKQFRFWLYGHYA